MPLILRPAEPADLSALVTLMNNAYRSIGPEASWNTESRYLAGPRTSEADLTDEIAKKPKACLLVARESADSPLQGCVLLAPLSDGRWHMGSLAVDPPLQKAGLGRRLLEAAEQWAAERGATTIQIEVVNVRDTLIAWYERRGYQLTGATNPFPYGDSRFGTPLRDDLSFVVLEKVLPFRQLPG
jgi:ribosomal protein S18 acetylase RimI-like enzyme